MAKSFTYEEAALPQSGSFSYEDAIGQPERKPGSMLLGDLGASIKSGVEQIPGMVTGLADIPFALAANARPVSKTADALGEITGFQPGKWAKEVEHSQEYKDVQRASGDKYKDIEATIADPNKSKMDVASSILKSAPDIAAFYAKNPGYVLNQVAESAPSMLAGGVASKGIRALGRASGLVAGAEEGATGLLSKETGDAAAAGLGEGTIQAGQQMDQGSDLPDQRANAIAAIGSGLGDALIAGGAGRLANKLGLETAETAMVKAGDKPGASLIADGAKPPPGFLKRVAGGALSEGALQELPQSMQEQMWQNYAEGKPLMEGVLQQGIEGGLAGAVMGAGANIRGHKAAALPVTPSDQDLNSANADLGAAVDSYTGLPSAQPQIGYNQVITPPNVSGQGGGLPTNIVEVQRQDGMGTTTINRATGPLSDAAADAVDSGLTSQAAMQAGPLLRAYQTSQDAQTALDSHPQADRMQIIRHPRVTDRFALVPKTAQALQSMDERAALAATNEARTTQLEQEDGNAAEPVAPTTPTTVEGALAQSVDDAAHQAATSPNNDLSEPTDAQKKAGNYRKGHVTVGGLNISLENPVGSTRSGVDAKGKPWSVTMADHYGYVKGTVGNDGDHVDTFVKAGTPLNFSGNVYVVDQHAPSTGKFDEHKAMIGYPDAATALAAYKANYAKGWKGAQSVVTMSLPQFKTWVNDGKKNMPVTQALQDEANQVAQSEAGQEELQAPVAQPAGEMPGLQKMGEKMADAARAAAQNRAASLAAEEAIPAEPKKVMPRKDKTATDPNAPQTAQAAADEAAQAEVAQSTGKMSQPRIARLPGESNEAYLARRAEQANKQRSERTKGQEQGQGLPTAERDVQTVRDAIGDPEADISIAQAADLPDASKAGKGKLSRQAAEFIQHIAKIFGQRVVFVNGMASDGMRKSGNTIYLSTDSSVSQLRVLGHEMTHAMKVQSRKSYNHMMDAVKALLTDEELMAQHKDYFGEDLADVADLDKVGEHTNGQTMRDFLAEEWMSDLSGNRFAESGFWDDVFKQIEAKHGSENAKGIIAKLRMALMSALNKLMAAIKGESFAVDQRMAEHLDEIRKAVAEGFASYAQDAKNNQLRDDDGAAKFSKEKSAAPETSAQHQMEITREDRELAASTRLSSAEQNVIGLESKRIKVPKAVLEREVRRIKAQFPTTGGWAPMEFDKVNKVKYNKKGILSMDTVEFKKQPYNFHLGTAGKDDSATHGKRITTVAKGISDEIVALSKRAEQGDKNAQITMDQISWYSKVAAMLHHQFGGFADFLAQLMGPTSANTPVEGNVKYAMGALKSAMSGKWDGLIADTIKWHEGVMHAAAGLDAVIEANKAKPKAERLTGKALAETKEFKDAMAAIKAAAPYQGQEPRQDSGAKFGMATQGIVEILANVWSDFQRGDAPKTKNYYQNLIGRQFTGATIDVWAARTLRRMAGLLRIPTSAEKGVAGKIGANLIPGAEFGFGQEAFVKAAENLRNSGVAAFANTTPADVQAMIWFSEKENWARNNWTNKVGEGGSAEAEFNLQGNADREGLEEARRLSRKGLPHIGNTKASATEEKVKQASIDAGVGQFPSAKDTPQYKARLEKIVAKAVQARNEARAQFESMRGSVDRWVAGVTPATDFTPTDATMAAVGAELESKVAMGADADKVLAFKAFPTMGRYGYDERSIDFEGVTRQGYNANDMLVPLLEVAKDHAQDGLLFGRVLRADEGIDYLRHRPGLELYLAKGMSMEKAQPILDKLDELGFKQFTFVVDSVRSPSVLSGKMGDVVGLRYIFTPEFSLREPNPEYGGDPTWSPAGLTDNQIRLRMEDKARELFKIATQLRAVAGVSSAEHQSYEANVYFWGDYENALADAGRGAQDSGGDAGWQGQPTRAGLERADRRREMDPGSEDAKSFTARRDVLRGDAKLSTQRAGPSTQDDGKDGRGPASHAVDLIGTHFSRQARANLDGRYNGTGLKGAEAKRLLDAVDPRIKERAYFYIDEGNGLVPEAGVGGIAHTANLKNLYNVKGDPLKLFKANDLNGSESRVLDAGYTGYYFPNHSNNQGIAVVLGNASRGIAVTPTGYEKGKAPVAAPEPYKRGLTSKELNAIDMPALQEVAPSAKLRAGTLSIDAGEVDAARTVLAKQGIDVPQSKLSTKRQPFYSALSKEVGAIKMTVAPGFGWRDAIKGMVNKGLIKQDEVEWTGVNDWLSMQQGKVTKDQVQSYLDANGVQVAETELAPEESGMDMDDWLETWATGRQGDTANTILDNGTWDEIRAAARDEGAHEVLHRLDRKTQPSKYEQYTLPGGENYREVLLTLPTDNAKRAWHDADIEVQKIRTEYRALLKADQDAAADMLKTKLDAAITRRGDLMPASYQSGHWDQKNVLAHIRVNDRTDADGKKVLFVEEIQSDWGQAAKKKGIKDPAADAELTQLLADGEAIARQKRELQSQEDAAANLKTTNLYLKGTDADRARIDKAEADARDKFNDLIPKSMAITARAQDLRQKLDGGVANAPFIGKTEGWLNLALKRIISMAVDGGYDKVAFVNGAQSADRYDLSKQIQSIKAEMDTDGTYIVYAKDNSGSEVLNQSFPASELPNAIGKDLADKVIADIPSESTPAKTYSGLDLKVGGEGMKAFYDSIVPNAVKSLLKKVGGGSLQAVDIAYKPERKDGDWTTTEFQVRRERGISQHDWDMMSTTERRRIVEESRGSPAMVQSPQSGFDVTDAMREKAAGGMPMFSKKRIVGDQGRAYTPDQLKAMANVGFEVEVPTLKERAQAMWKDAGKKLAQGLADQFAPVKDIDSAAYGLLRLAKGAAGSFEALLKGGMLKLTDNVYDFDDTKKGGVIDRLLTPLGLEHHDFFRWVAANRAERLMAQGRETLFTPADIAALKTLGTGTASFDYTIQHGPRAGQTTRNRAEIYRDSLVTFNEFNKNVLDMAEKSGLIDGASRHLWEHEFYVPFYRVADEDDGGVRGMNIKGAAVRQQAFKALKGGKDKLNADLLDNTLMNWAHLLDAAAKNRAAKATIEAAERVGIATGGNQSTLAAMGSTVGNKSGVVWFMDGGQKRYSLIDNQGDGKYLMTAISSLEYAGMRNPAMNAMGAMKHALTVGITASPFFKVRNLIRDSVQVIGTGPISYNVAKNLADGWKRTDPKSDAYFRLLAGGGTIHFGTMMEGSEAKRVQALVESGVDSATILNNPSKVKAFYRSMIEPAVTAYNELGNRGEAINRAALYHQLVSQGVSHAEASLQARDLMDFSMQGSFTSVRFLTQVVPFMNARIQGLYKLGKAAKEDPARFSAVLGATALFSLMLLAAYHDDDDWKKRSDSDRNNFWWFKFGGVAYRIPKPFEIGSMGTLAERGFELAFEKEMTNKRFMGQVLALLSDNLSMNPIPQLVKPMLDVYANTDSFTGNPIENMAQQKLKSEYRFNDRTSMAARGASTAMNAVTGAVGKEALSPVQIDHMLQGYFGWLGTFVVSGADVLARPATSQPTQATPDYMKVVTGNMASHLEDAPSRYVGQIYTQFKEVQEAYDTWKLLQKEGKVQEAKQYFQDNKEEIQKFPRLENAKRSETLFNNMLRMVERNADMSADEKRVRVREINAMKDRVARTVN